MILEFDKSFDRDLDIITDKKILSKLENLISLIKEINEIYKIPTISKLKGYDKFYRIRLGRYRIGLE